VVDATMDVGARVPEKFRKVQWTHLPDGETSIAFVDRVRRLVGEVATAGEIPPAAAHHSYAQPQTSVAPAMGKLRAGNRTALALGSAMVLLAAAAVYLSQGRTPVSAPGEISPPAPTRTASAFAPPPHSVAVLPFVNMSGDPKQDYFSDGLSEELLNSLATIPDLQVAARTSSFFFKGKEVDLSDVARKLNVGTVLEGSVRKDGNQVRITAQLINAVTGYHMWSQTYDRDLKNILSLQTEIATAVTHAMQATLMADAATTIELGGTRNPHAFDAYLRGEKLMGHLAREAVLERIAAYDEAIRLDPLFAKAYVGKALANNAFGGYLASSSETGRYMEQARAAAEKAIALAPNLGQAHAALALILANDFDYPRALAEVERALTLSPGDSAVLRAATGAFAFMGMPEQEMSVAQRAVTLDPLNARSYSALGSALYHSRQFERAIEAFDSARRLDPGLSGPMASRGLSYRMLGKLEVARESCSEPPIYIYSHVCLAIVYHQEGRIPEAQQEVKMIMDDAGDSAAFQFAEIYAQWGDVPKALDWLDTAYRLHDEGLGVLKTSSNLDPLRKEPRYLEIERKLNFPK
jgi:TolB-like protein/tetratricopeptide (TPR) repeat protein